MQADFAIAMALLEDPGMDMQSLEREARGLSLDDRARLALNLIESLEVLPPAEAKQLWVEEAVRRAGQVQSASVELVPAETVSARARALFR